MNRILRNLFEKVDWPNPHKSHLVQSGGVCAEDPCFVSIETSFSMKDRKHETRLNGTHRKVWHLQSTKSNLPTSNILWPFWNGTDTHFQPSFFSRSQRAISGAPASKSSSCLEAISPSWGLALNPCRRDPVDSRENSRMKPLKNPDFHGKNMGKTHGEIRFKDDFPTHIAGDASSSFIQTFMISKERETFN